MLCVSHHIIYRFFGSTQALVLNCPKLVIQNLLYVMVLQRILDYWKGLLLYSITLAQHQNNGVSLQAVCLLDISFCLGVTTRFG